MARHAPLDALSLAIAMAVLADAHAPQQRSPGALAARVRACWLGDSAAPGELPAGLREQLRRLAALPARDWARLTPQHIAHWLCHGRWQHMAGKRNGMPGDLGDLGDSGDELPLMALDAIDDLGAHDLDLWGNDDDEGHADDEGAGHPVPEAHGLPARLLAADFRQWATAQTQALRRWLLRPPAHALPAPLWLAAASVASRPPQWHTAADVAQALNLTLDELLWLAPAHAHWRERSGGALPPSHHRHRLQRKASGGLRLLEVPLPRLAAAQQRVLAAALAGVPVHEAAHGFVRGRSVRTHVAPHVGQAVVLRFDLRDFFTQVHAARVRAIWQALGHAPAAADVLTRLCTVRTPAAVRERLAEAALHDMHDPWDGHGADGVHEPAAHTAGSMWSARTQAGSTSARLAAARAQSQRLARPHLAQGAPTSPALANLCAFGLDVRLCALAERFGAHYSRYADDLVFSGPAELRGQLRNLRAWVAAIVRAEGFALNREKTRVMQAHQRQQVTGVVLNQRANLSRSDYDALKARLHRLSRSGPVPAPERARLAGQLQWARQWLAPSRQAKLLALFQAIEFEAR